MKYPGEIYEESERKILKECVHTRNKHIEIEERYEKLVERKSSKIDLSALERVLRKKDSDEEGIKTTEDAVFSDCEQANPEEAGLNAEEEFEVEKDTEGDNICEIKAADEEEETVSFGDILELQKRIKSRVTALSDEDFLKLFFGDEKTTRCEQYLLYNEPVLAKCTAAEEEPEEDLNEYEEIVSVEVDEIILPEKDGIGTVFAVPLENKEVRSQKQEVNMKKSALGIVMAVAVLIIGALLIYSMWPAGV
ncbi:MAG: hypothetical protein E7228_00655 [Clostridiales bacterium]|nr:hypothetical protein [Clostridiales bacterium]